MNAPQRIPAAPTAVSDRSDPIAWLSNLTPRLLHRLGCMMLGAPHSIHPTLPADFYLPPADRAMPAPLEGDDYKQLTYRVYVDRMRRKLSQRVLSRVLIVNLATILISFVICIVVLAFARPH